MAILVKSEYGEVSVNNSVIAMIAGEAANKCYGVVGMAARGKKDGIVNLLKPDNMTKGIGVSVEDSGVVIDMHIVVEFGVNIKVICDSIMNNVKYKVEEFTGLKIERINIYVEGVRVID